MEKGCKWHFGKEGGIDIGPNDPIHQTFKGNPYYSIVREAIQNSLDAISDNRFPVHVSFQYFDLDRLQYPLFFQLEEHIKQAMDYYKNNSDAQRLFGEMIKYLNGTEKGIKKLKVSCLKISDSNTKGMPYDGGTESPFYAFLRAAGVSAKGLIGSGGSFGFGKGAYFALSPIKTLIVSSKDTNGIVYFEGVTRLTTHRSSAGDKITAYGFYDNNNGEPVTIEDNIPEIFKRTETGSDINIIGLWDEIDRKKLMIKSVLNNFWLAIHELKLVVTIDEVLISKENLEQIIDEYFPNVYESGNATEIESWNPKPYYKAVKYAEANDQFRIFNDELDTIGKVKLFVYLEKGLPNRTSFFRKPKMVVFKRTNRKINGYAAVFICESDKGNSILRMMENPAHNEWKKENYPNDEGRIHKLARKAENEFSDYVNEKLDSITKLNINKKVSFLGLEEFLSIPEDLLEKDDDLDISGENESIYSGSQTNDLSLVETGMETTNKDEHIAIKPSIKLRSDIKEESKADLTDEDLEYITAGADNKTSGGSKLGNADGSAIVNGEQSVEPTNSRVLVTVRLKVAAQKENGELYHNLIVSADKDITKADIEFLVSGDNDKEDSIAISSSNKGQVQGSKLIGVALSAGKNQIKIRFADNLKHSLKIKAYELK